MKCKILISLGFFFICTSGFGQDSTSVIIEGFEPEGVLSKPRPYSILKSQHFQEDSKVVLTSSIFPKSKEILNESSAHWSSDAVEIELHGFDHDYLTLRILILEKKYRVEFHWISDVLPNSQVTIEPLSSELKLSSDDFKKGSVFHGTIRFKGTCKGNEYDGKDVELYGHFNFKIQ